MALYDELMANAPQGAAPVQISNDKKFGLTYQTPTATQVGYQAPQLQAPKPSFGDRIDAITHTMPNVYAEKVLGVGKWVGSVIGSSVEHANTVAGSIQSWNPFNIPAQYQRFRDVQTYTQAKDTAQKTIDNATQQYQDGTLSKEDYHATVKQANQDVANASLTVFNHYIPKNKNEVLDYIDGAVTLATLGIDGAAYAAARGGTQLSKDFVLNGFRDFVANKIGVAESTLQAMRTGAEIAPYGYKTSFRITADATKLAEQTKPTTLEKILLTTSDAIEKTPLLRRQYNYMLRQMGTSEAAKGLAKNVVMQLALTSPMRRANMQYAADIVQNMRDDNWFHDGNKLGAIPESILMASFLLEGGPVGALVRGAKKTGQTFRYATYGEKTFYDTLDASLRKMGVQGSLYKGLEDYLKEAPDYIARDTKAILKQFMGTNMARGGIDKAVSAIVSYLDDAAKEGGKQLSDRSMKEIVKQFAEHTYAQNLLQEFNKTGLNVVAARYSQETQDQLRVKIEQAFNTIKAELQAETSSAKRLAMRKDAATQIIKDAIKNNETWAQHEAITTPILDRIANAETKDAILAASRAPYAGRQAKFVSKEIQRRIKDLGYIPVTSENPRFFGQLSQAATENLTLKSKFVEVNDKLFEQAAQAKPFFKQVGTALTKAGLSLDESASVAYRLVRDNAVDNIGKTLAVDAPQARRILNALQQYTDTGVDTRIQDLLPGGWHNIPRRTASDIRMLTNGEIKTAITEAGLMTKTELTQDVLTKIRRDIINAHTAVPYQTMGLADALIAGSYRYNPFYKYYARIQGALRYTYNPFFAIQEQVETESLGQLLVPGKKPWLAGISNILTPHEKANLDGIVKRLDEAGFFNNSALVGANDKLGNSLMATRFGEAAQDVYIGRVSAHITEGQKRSIAAAVQKVADRMGMTVEDAVALQGKQIEDLIRPIVQYPTHGALNSNLAKALNIAVFPARYNLKVTALAVKALSQAPPAVQLLTINKLWEMENWLKTPEGVRWQYENAAAIQLFKWITPVGNIQWVFDMLQAPFGTSNIQSVGDIGLIGGLPFGVIGQILQNQGLFNLNTPYVSPKDGSIYSRKIPDTMKARVYTALMDLLGSTFTYPGAQIGLDKLGLPTKSKILQSAATKMVGSTNASDWNVINYTPADLPAFDKMRQQIYQEEYSVKSGAKKAVVPTAPALSPQPFVTQPNIGKVSTKSELNSLKKQKQSSSKKSARQKTTSFPSNLPQ